MTAERDFAAWIDRRDAAALGRVFDATAGRMLLLAVHLAGSGANAEDLVQATFLAAMARAESWDRRRPLWPWLAGILHNEAGMHWRRVQRRREVGLAAAAGEVGEAPDPARLAASDEAFAAVVATIDAMPLPYRQVLRLRLLHGLQPIEIARALEVPVGTVRAQLHRGLEQLRQALPTGVALAVGAWLLSDGALLAQVKAQVMSKAGTIAAAGAVAAPVGLVVAGGWWTMYGKTVGVVVAAVAMLCCLGYLLDTPSGLGAAPAPREPAQPVAGDVGAQAAKPTADSRSELQRTGVDEVPAPAWPLVVTVTHPGGAPIAGASVRVWVAARGQVQNQTQGDGLREDVAAGETEADGTYRCALDACRERSPLYRASRFVFVTASAPGSGIRENVMALPRTSDRREFATEIELRPGVGIGGRVVDALGQPVAGARLYLVHSGAQQRLEPTYARSAGDGGFCVPTDSEWEQWPAGVVAADAQLGGAFAAVPRPEAMPVAGTTIDLGSLVLDGGSAILGQVVLGDGSPLGDYPLYVTQIDPDLAGDPVAIRRSFYQRERGAPPLVVRHGRVLQTTAEANTRADGTFVCAGLDPEATYAVCVRDARLVYHLLVARPGAEPVRLEVDGQLLKLDVRSEQGEVLQGIDLMAEAFDPEVERSTGNSRPGFAAGGMVVRNAFLYADAQGRVMLLSPFGWIWRIGLNDERVQPDFVRHEVIAGVCRAERSFVLRAETRFGSLRLTVVDEEGKPYPTFGYVLKGVGRDLERNHRLSQPPPDGMVRDLPACRWQLSVHLGEHLRYGYWGNGPAARGSDEREILIEDGRTTDVKIVVRALGRVAFRVTSDVPLANLQDLRIRSETDGQEVAVDSIVPMDAVIGGGPQRPVLFARRAFAPGRHAFVITAKHHLPARHEVDIAADAATEVEVELQPVAK